MTGGYSARGPPGGEMENLSYLEEAWFCPETLCAAAVRGRWSMGYFKEKKHLSFYYSLIFFF